MNQTEIQLLTIQFSSVVQSCPTLCDHMDRSTPGFPVGASHGGSEKSGKLEVGGASRDSTGFGALEEGLMSS